MGAFPTQFAGGALQGQTLQSIQRIGTMVMPTQGNVYFVAPRTGSDTQNSGTSASSPFKTLANALTFCTANQNDIVYLLEQSNTAGSTTDYQSTTLDWSKDGVHLIGVNNGSFIGQRSRVSNLSTAAALNPMFKVSANNCLIANIEFFQGTPGSGTTSIAMLVTGQRNRIVNCQISGMGDLTGVADVSGSRSLKVSGSENLFQHCYIGLDTVIRATMVEEVEISGGARNVFEDCWIDSYTSLSTFKAVAIGTAVDRFVMFNRCTFSAQQVITSAVAPTGAIGMTTINGQVYAIQPAVYGYSLLSTGGNTSLKVLAFQNATTVQGIGASAAAS